MARCRTVRASGEEPGSPEAAFDGAFRSVRASGEEPGAPEAAFDSARRNVRASGEEPGAPEAAHDGPPAVMAGQAEAGIGLPSLRLCFPGASHPPCRKRTDAATTEMAPVDDNGRRLALELIPRVGRTADP